MTSTELAPIDAVLVEQVDTDATLIDAWLHGVPAPTQREYRREIRNLLTYAGKSLQYITMLDIQAYERDCLMCKADTTRARSISAIKSLYKRLRQSGLIQVNPAEFLRLPKVKETIAERYLTPEQVDAIITQAKCQRDRVMLDLFYMSGMRVSEIVALSWHDILPTATGATLTVYGKGQKTRYIAIDEQMRDELFSLPHTADCVFPSGKTGTVMTTTQAQRIVVDCAAKAGIDASPHYLRHAHASHLIENGIDVVAVRDELGHASIATTNRYAHSRAGKPLGSVLRRK